MSIFGEFRVAADTFTLSSTLEAVPEAVVEIDRVVASREVLTPYFWVSDVSFEAFESAAEDDATIRDLHRLDGYEDARTALYRAEWTDQVDALVTAFIQSGTMILEALGRDDQWELRIRFDDTDALDRFQERCASQDMEFEVERLYRTEQPQTGGQYGLTKKQQEALVTAWEEDYFETPRENSLSDVAAELGIAQQSLSDRLRRAHNRLVANTLVVTSPDTLGEDE